MATAKEWTSGMRPSRMPATFLRLLLAASVVSAASAHTPQCTSTGDLEIISFASKVFPAPRSLRILLPAGYHLPANRKHRYPVLYLNDGQNLFDVCTAIFNREEWRVDETVGELVASGKLDPLIVVGIDNGGRRLRPKEYLPYVDETLSPPEPHPESKFYPHFLLDEVVPFVESRYRVLPGPRNRVLGGSSYGAGIALFTVMNRPGSFGGLLLESPSIYADGDHLLRDAASVRIWPHRIYVGAGTVQEPVEDVQKLEAVLRRAGLGNDRLCVVVQQGAAHSEKWWAGRLAKALQFLFSPPL
jgi:enterochelin esterase-like enzyme